MTQLDHWQLQAAPQKCQVQFRHNGTPADGGVCRDAVDPRAPEERSICFYLLPTERSLPVGRTWRKGDDVPLVTPPFGFEALKAGHSSEQFDDQLFLERLMAAAANVSHTNLSAMKSQPFRNQCYKKLKKQLLKENKWFTDLEFPPTNASLYFDPKRNEGLEWKRPGDIVDNPHLFVEGISVDDVLQGVLGNCWFVAACSALTRHKRLWTKVIPDVDEQEWSDKDAQKYCGIFHFCFWRFGHWVDVVVDDLLPTRNGRLIYAHSKTKNEFWCALLEKAFAKLNGCYESLSGGTLAEALVAITGGVPFTIKLDNDVYADSPTARMELFNQLKKAFNEKALMAVSIKANTLEEVEEPLECGLLKGHSYAITEVKRLSLDSRFQSLFSSLFNTPEKVMMVRLQNPWGEKEWNGAWSDGAAEWNQISKDQQRELGLKIEENGEFWMSWEDLCAYFTTIDVCYQYETSLFSLNNRYHEYIFHGVWQCGDAKDNWSDRSGGCANNKSTCLRNPQYRLDVLEDNSELIASLIQRGLGQRRRQKAAYLTIGLMLVKVEDNRIYRLHKLSALVATSDYAPSESVLLYLKNLRRGRYVIIPSTFAPREEGEFMLRLYTSWNARPAELLLDAPTAGRCSCLGSSFSCVTQLQIAGAAGLHASKGAINPYCIVKCEGQSVRSSVCKDTKDPIWDLQCIFVRRKSEKPIKVEVWSANLVKDAFLGCLLLNCPPTNDKTTAEKLLEGKGKESDNLEPGHLGKIMYSVSTFDDPYQL
uniref:Calpain catalytic domain-containing protein n=1 Tax=Trichuris muris TaxID=70415 RepID=A0A5S6QYS9_TRIMR